MFADFRSFLDKLYKSTESKTPSCRISNPHAAKLHKNHFLIQLQQTLSKTSSVSMPVLLNSPCDDLHACQRSSLQHVWQTLEMLQTSQ